MKTIVDVNVGQLEVSRSGVILRAAALGSCIGAAVYDAGARTGGLAHIMLPGEAPSGISEKSRYAVDAIDELVARIERAGARCSDLEGCLAGAGNVLQNADDTVCDDNIASVTEILSRKCIPIRATLLGGVNRKSISLDVAAGLVCCTEGESDASLLWDFFHGINRPWPRDGRPTRHG